MSGSPSSGHLPAYFPFYIYAACGDVDINDNGHLPSFFSFYIFAGADVDNNPVGIFRPSFPSRYMPLMLLLTSICDCGNKSQIKNCLYIAATFL